MKSFFSKILDAFGWRHIAEKPFPFRLNDQPLTDFPDSVDKFVDYIISVVLPRKTHRVIASNPEKGTRRIHTPEELRASLRLGHMINMIG